MADVFESTVKVFEKEKIKGKRKVIIAFPDVGLVGTIAIKHFIEEKKPKEIGYISSHELSPVIAIEDGFLKPQIRIYDYAEKEILIVFAEFPIPPYIFGELSDEIAVWLKDKAELCIILGGLPNQRRIEIEVPKIYGVVTHEELKNIFEKEKIKMLEEGFIIGPNAGMLMRCYENDIKAGYLLADSHFGYPDPGAAASVLKMLAAIYDFDINVDKLIEREEEIRLMTRNLMKSTEDTLKEIQKKERESLPIMYG